MGIAELTLVVRPDFIHAADASRAVSETTGNLNYLLGAVDRARLVVAELNDQVPSAFCVEPLNDDDIDMIVHTARPPVELERARIGQIERAIAAHAAAFIPGEATIEIGLGGIPEALLQNLSERRVLGIHSAVIGDGVVDLIEAGVVTNDHKDVDAGVATACLLIGTDRLYGFAHLEPRILMAPISRTYGLATLSRLRRFVAINSAL